MAGDVRIGCSGWSYPHWRKRFYPEKMPAREHFAFYAQHFNTVELNNSFYRQPPRERFEAWRQQAPPGFLFAVKGSRYVTHIKRLAVEKKSIDLVVDAALGLGEKLGPILFQLQANFHVDLERLERLIGMLPTDERFTLEFRNDSWNGSANSPRNSSNCGPLPISGRSGPLPPIPRECVRTGSATSSKSLAPSARPSTIPAATAGKTTLPTHVRQASSSSRSNRPGPSSRIVSSDGRRRCSRTSSAVS